VVPVIALFVVAADGVDVVTAYAVVIVLAAFIVVYVVVADAVASLMLLVQNLLLLFCFLCKVTVAIILCGYYSYYCCYCIVLLDVVDAAVIAVDVEFFGGLKLLFFIYSKFIFTLKPYDFIFGLKYFSSYI